MKENSSFRDPNGFIFYHDQQLYRAINHQYKKNYDHLIGSGLYNLLVNKGYLIPHNEVNLEETSCKDFYKVIKPVKIPFISYPYEWAFSQLKDAAILTLEIQLLALKFGMTLKDASSYNIQFFNGKPILIDTLSFEIYEEGYPWKAYRQYCQHFLAPLALMGKKDVRLNSLLKNYIDGIPLDLTCKLLPRKAVCSAGILLHIYLHASAQKKYHSNNVNIKLTGKKISKNSLLILINSLLKTTKKISLRLNDTEWSGYYNARIHQNHYTDYKKTTISRFLDIVKPNSLWDLGANTGLFSRIAAEKEINVIAFDIDPLCVENNYLKVKEKNEKNILPLLLDLTNPSPSIGWANTERLNIKNRTSADMIMALALVHHLTISNNLPMSMIAEYFSHLAHYMAIEFVPKDDDKVQILLKNREDIFSEYSRENFEKVFLNFYDIIIKNENPFNNRILYLMKLKSN